MIRRVWPAAGLLIPASATACPFCDIGARDTWTFILLVVGGFIAAAAMMLVWSVKNGDYRDAEGVNLRVLELDRLTGVKL
jgi:cbb3-type cytochrome oxidase maturation protein